MVYMKSRPGVTSLLLIMSAYQWLREPHGAASLLSRLAVVLGGMRECTSIRYSLQHSKCRFDYCSMMILMRVAKQKSIEQIDCSIHLAVQTSAISSDAMEFSCYSIIYLDFLLLHTFEWLVWWHRKHRLFLDRNLTDWDWLTLCLQSHRLAVVVHAMAGMELLAVAFVGRYEDALCSSTIHFFKWHLFSLCNKIVIIILS